MLKELTTSDKEIIASISPVVDSIAALLGSHTEVVLHSLDIDNPSVVKIVNGHITGRTVGAPITDLAINQLKEPPYVATPYFTKTTCGKRLRSVTTVITNKINSPIALLCINSDMETPIMDIVSSLAPSGIHLPTDSPETFSRSAEEMLRDAIHRIKARVDTSDCRKRERTAAIIREMYTEGLFNVKDAVQHTANGLGVSSDTVYRNLRALRSSAID